MIVSARKQKIICFSISSIAFLIISLFHFRFGYYFEGKNGFSIGNDDAFITFRYAKNFIEHGVLSFNINDSPKVEGFSNPLYLMISAIVYLFVGSDSLYFAMALLGIGSVLFSLFFLADFLFNRLGFFSTILILISLALCPPLWIHSSSGLETAWVFSGQLLLWMAAASYSEDPSDQKFLRILALSVFIVLLRTDGFVFPFFVASWFLLKGDTRISLSIFISCSLVFLFLVILRLGYYGLPMPLTFFAKISGDLLDRFEVAVRYVASISLKNGMLFPLIGIFLLLFVHLRLSLLRVSGSCNVPPLEVWVVGLLIIYYIYIGGDIYRDRFLLIIFPIGLYCLYRFLSFFEAGRFVRLSVGFSIIIAQLAAFKFDDRLEYFYENPKYDQWIELGKFLSFAHPDALLAIDAAGKVPYYSELETIDMLGLNDIHIAMSEAKGSIPGHNKFDPDYVFRRQPDLICAHVYGKGDLAYGIDRARYEEEGFSLQYLVRSRGVDGEKILIIADREIELVPSILEKGYSYGCVMRSMQ